MERFCRDYLGTFAAAKTPGEKLVLIDTLIHRLQMERERAMASRKIGWIRGLSLGLTLIFSSYAAGEVTGAEDADKAQVVRFKFRELPLRTVASWTQRAARSPGLVKEETMHFTIQETGLGMRWYAELPHPVDIEKTPYAVVRYKATGNIGGSYTIWLGSGGATGMAAHSGHPLNSSDLIADGRWRSNVKRVSDKWVGEKWQAGELAVGLECQSGRADLWLDYIEFRPAEPKKKITDALSFTPIEKRESLLEKRFLPISLPRRRQDEAFSIPDDLDDCDVFSHPNISIRNIPFQVAPLKEVPETGLAMEDQKPLKVRLPTAARELFLLIWSKIPPCDPYGGPSKPPITHIDQSERFTVELAYKNGKSDFFIPYNVTEGQYGLKRGLYLYVIHPEVGSMPERLMFHDKMNRSSFGLVALTGNSGEPISPEPELREIIAWYPAVQEKLRSPTRRTRVDLRSEEAILTDGIIRAEVNLAKGARWDSLLSPVYGKVSLAGGGIFAVQEGDRWISSEKWEVVDRKTLKDGASIDLRYKEGGLSLRGRLTLALAGDGKVKLGLSLKNRGRKPFLGRVRFPVLEGLKLGSLEDTWYFFPRRGGAMIHHIDGGFKAPHGHDHPLQIDSFFNPREWFALTLSGNDVKGQFHWYDVGKSKEGGWYRREYLEKRVKPNSEWILPDFTVAISPGDWHASFDLYREWVSTWHKPTKPEAREWYRRMFVLGWWRTWPELRKTMDFVGQVKEAREAFGYCDALHLYAWHVRDKEQDANVAYFGEYDSVAIGSYLGGEENFKASIKKANENGIPISLYNNAIIINDGAYAYGKKREEWAVRDIHGKVYRATGNRNTTGYRPCLSIEGWLEYMVDATKYQTQDLGSKIVYLDEFGYGARTCYSQNHPHDSPEPHYYGERELTRKIRAAIPEDVPICTEYPPEDIRIQFQDGTYGSAIGYSNNKWTSVPMEMVRFAFPDFKILPIFYHYSLRDGNWDLLKFVLFNGDGYGLGRSYGPKVFFEERSLNLIKKIFRILNENVDAFTSHEVEPLIATEIPGVFANRFTGKNKVIWTLYNANYRTARGTVLKVDHVQRAKYVDLWNDAPVKVEIEDKRASLGIELGPRELTCISQSE